MISNEIFSKEWIEPFRDQKDYERNDPVLLEKMINAFVDKKYATFYEGALYNHILGSHDPNSSMVCYFMPLEPGAFKLYSTKTNSFWCCVGSGFENHAKYGEGIYYHDGTGLLSIYSFLLK